MHGIAPVTNQFSAHPLRSTPAIDNSENKNLATRALDTLSELSKNDTLEGNEIAQSMEVNELSTKDLLKYQEYMRKRTLVIQVIKNGASEGVSALKTLSQS